MKYYKVYECVSLEKHIFDFKSRNGPESETHSDKIKSDKPLGEPLATAAYAFCLNAC